MAWFGEKIWSWVGIPTPEGRWVFFSMFGQFFNFLKKLPGSSSGSGSFEGNSESKESPIPSISKPSKN
jgi:hypothetical protein